MGAAWSRAAAQSRPSCLASVRVALKPIFEKDNGFAIQSTTLPSKYISRYEYDQFCKRYLDDDEDVEEIRKGILDDIKKLNVFLARSNLRFESL